MWFYGWVEDLVNPMTAAGTVLALVQGAACTTHDILRLAVCSRAAGCPVALTKAGSSPAPLVGVVVAALPTPAFVTAIVSLVIWANISCKEGSFLVPAAAGIEALWLHMAERVRSSVKVAAGLCSGDRSEGSDGDE